MEKTFRFNGREEGAIGIFYPIELQLIVSPFTHWKEQTEELFNQIHEQGYEPGFPANLTPLT